MAIRAKKTPEGKYLAELLLPDMPGVKAEWKSPAPMSRDELYQELVSRGAHPVDVSDALNQAVSNRKPSE